MAAERTGSGDCDVNAPSSGASCDQDSASSPNGQQLPSDKSMDDDVFLKTEANGQQLTNGNVKKEPILKKRETWATRFDFLLAICGASVGLGNVWRFPYLCYKNGGGVFLIPYFICVLFGGIPLFFLEVSVGQFMGECIVGAYGRLCPLLKGLGITSTIVEAYICIYYNVIMAWCLYYTFASFTSVLPWSTCNNKWNTETCLDFSATNPAINVTAIDMSAQNESIMHSFVTQPDPNTTQALMPHTDPATEYWQ